MLYQSFVGVEFECEGPHPFDPTEVTLMGSLAANEEGLSFVYALPLGPNRAIVEWTRFGTAPIKRELLAGELDHVLTGLGLDDVRRVRTEGGRTHSLHLCIGCAGLTGRHAHHDHVLGRDAMMVQVAAPRVGTARATARLRHVPIETIVFPGLALTTLALLAFGLPMLSPQVGAAYVVLAGAGGAMVSGVQAGLAPLALAGLLVAAVVFVRQRPHESVEIVLASVLALACEPLVFFLVYFCALHSFRHLRAGFAEERGGVRLPALIVVVYTVVPILAVGTLLFVIGPSGDMPEQILQVLFIGLAGLTVPHMIVVSHEKRHQKKLRALPG